ncbi:lipase family protein [candidate division KSB1 bacterium]|nr:lipase family protein [candidate division KSB1 bacterium]
MKITNRKFILKNKQNIFSPNLKYKYFENCQKYPFRANEKGFSVVNAWWLAEFSFLSYTPQDFIKSQINQAGIKSFRFFESFKCKCFVANTSDFAIVAFRGTATKSTDLFIDLIDNLSIKLTDFREKEKVHYGFYSAFKDIWNGNSGFKEYLYYLQENNPKIKFYFTGHSLGAAVASLAAASFKNCHALYTFGAPKVGNLAFANSLEQKTYRIVNFGDLVTLLPPSFSNKEQNEYVHHGTIKFIDKSKSLAAEIKFPDNQYTISITIASKIIDIIFDKDKSMLLKIVDLTDTNIKIHLSPVTLVSRLLRKLKRIILRTKEIKISNHAPIYYAVHLWNMNIKNLPFKNIQLARNEVHKKG